MKPQHEQSRQIDRFGILGLELSLASLMALALASVLIGALIDVFGRGVRADGDLYFTVLLGVMAGLVLAVGLALRTEWWPVVSSCPFFVAALDDLKGVDPWIFLWLAVAINLMVGEIGVLIGKRRSLRSS